MVSPKINSALNAVYLSLSITSVLSSGMLYKVFWKTVMQKKIIQKDLAHIG
jgi:hypothetical protein